MKEKIHPEYEVTTTTCACGAKYNFGSTKKNIKVDICSACHPLFTGTQKLLDTEGRVQRFKKKFQGKVATGKKGVKKATKKKTTKKKK